MKYNRAVEKSTLDEIKEKVVPILREAGVLRSSIFGSYVRGEEREDSDIDILVEFPKGKSLLDLVDLQNKLEEALHKRVDVNTYNALFPPLRESVYKQAQQIL